RAFFVVARRKGLQVSLAGELRVDDDCFRAGKLHDQVWPQPAVLCGDVNLRLEVAMLEHAGHFNDTTELDLAPAAADVGAVAQRAYEVARLVAQDVLRLGELANLHAQLGVRSRTRYLELLELPVNLLQRLLDRLNDVLDS